MKKYIIYLLLLIPGIASAQDTLIIDTPIRIIGEGLKQQTEIYYIQQKKLGSILLDEVSWTYYTESSTGGYYLITEAESVADSVRFSYPGMRRIRYPSEGFVTDTLHVTGLDTISVSMKAYYKMKTYDDRYRFPYAKLFQDIAPDTTMDSTAVDLPTFEDFTQGIKDINNQ